MKRILATCVICMVSAIGLGQDAGAQGQLDQQLADYIIKFKMKSPAKVEGLGSESYQFGKMLFADTQLSLVGDISCRDCHHPDFGSGDGIPFSIGTGGQGLGHIRIQGIAAITARNAPHLYNKGSELLDKMFWDGRVSYNSLTKSFQTPVEGLNGETPLYSDIVTKIENVMAMQALFPMESVAEMRGEPNAHLSAREVWAKISSRIRRDPRYQKYIGENFNIADIANALAFFQKVEFQVNDTPFDKYMQGDIQALSWNEKQGAKIYFEAGRCANCHFGELLTNRAFQSVASPQVGPGLDPGHNDEGRFYVTGRDNGKYRFATQPLRNTALTAPYFHNGAYNTLREVIEHYDNPNRAIHNYDLNSLQNTFERNYNDVIFADRNPYHNFYRVQALPPILRQPLQLTSTEKDQLECFLTKSLTQEKYHSQVNISICDDKFDFNGEKE